MPYQFDISVGVALRSVRLSLLAGAMFASSAQAQAPAAAPPAPAQREIAHLLDYVGRSGCEFNRNGSWHDSAAARSHLRDKYDYLAKRKLAPTAELFIERGASASSMSGKAYLIRCKGGESVPSARWLGEELARYRAGSKSAR